MSSVRGKVMDNRLMQGRNKINSSELGSHTKARGKTMIGGLTIESHRSANKEISKLDGTINLASEKLYLVLEMIGVAEPEKEADAPLSKLHRIVESAVKDLIANNTFSNKKTDCKSTGYLDKLLTVLDLLQLEDTDEALSMNSLRFSRYIEGILEEKSAEKSSKNEVSKLKVQMEGLSELLSVEKQQNASLRSEIIRLASIRDKGHTLNSKPDKQGLSISRNDSNQSVVRTVRPKLSGKLHINQDISGFETKTTPLRSSKKLLQSADLLKLIAERVRRLSGNSSSADTIQRVSSKHPRNPYTQVRSSADDCLGTSPDHLVTEHICTIDSPEDVSGDERIFQLQEDLHMANLNIESLSQEILNLKLSISKRDSTIECTRFELDDTRKERDNACAQVDELIDVVREVEKTIQEVSEERDQEFADREDAEIALEEQIQLTTDLKKEIDELKKRIDNFEIFRPIIKETSLPVLLHSPTFQLVEPTKSTQHYESSIQEDRTSVPSQNHLLVESVKVDDWSSIEGGRKRSETRDLDDQAIQDWRNQVNESQAHLRDELEKRDSRMKDLELTLARLAMSHHFKSIGLSKEDEEGKAGKRGALGGVLRNRKISVTDNQVDGAEIQSVKRSQIGMEKKSVRILQTTEDGVMSIVDTGRGSPERFSSYSKVAHKSKHFDLKPQHQNQLEVSKDGLLPSEEVDESHSRSCMKHFSQSISGNPHRSSRNKLEKLGSQDNKLMASHRSQSIDRSRDRKRNSKSKHEKKSSYSNFVEDIQAEEKSRREFSVKSKYLTTDVQSPTSRKSNLRGQKSTKSKGTKQKSIVIEACRDKDDSFDSRVSNTKNHPQTERVNESDEAVLQYQVGLSVPSGMIRNPINTARKLSDMESAEELILSKLNSEREISKNPVAALILAQEENNRTFRSDKIFRQNTTVHRRRNIKDLQFKKRESEKWEPVTGRVANRKHEVESRPTMTPGNPTSRFFHLNASPQSRDEDSGHSPL